VHAPQTEPAAPHVDGTVFVVMHVPAVAAEQHAALHGCVDEHAFVHWCVEDWHELPTGQSD
jgi:hypothetical protein